MKHNNLVAKSAYVPTNTSSKKKKKPRNDRIILSTNWSSNPANRIGCDSRSLDFNVKIGSNDTEFPKNMGKFGKGLIDSSGRLDWRSGTWTAPFWEYKTYNKTTWRNPVRNQIDFIIFRVNHQTFVCNLWSYEYHQTEIERKLVAADMKIDIPRSYRKKNKEITSINI